MADSSTAPTEAPLTPPGPPPADAPAPESYPMTVTRVIDECTSIKTLVLEPSPGRLLAPWQPGSHIDLTLPSGLVRKYSLCGDPEDTSHYRVAVLADPQSRGGSIEIHRIARTGLTLSVTGPRNRFPLVDSYSYLFVAGGIGITPILPMVRALAAGGKDWRLVYGGRSRSTMAFIEEVGQFESDRVEIVAEDDSGIIDIARVLREQAMGTTIYCCGPGGLITALREAAGDFAQISDVMFEQFTVLENASHQAANDEVEFTVECARSGSTIVVPPGRSVLSMVLEQVDPAFPFDCNEGFCGSCEVAVLGGEPEHRDDFLTQAERESNKVMMICVGRSKTERLVLDL